MPATAPVGSSPTMAPTRLAAIATFIEVNRNGTEAGTRSFQNTCAGARIVGAHQVEIDRLGRAQPLHHADGDRKERQIGRDQRLRDQPGHADRGEHDDDHRRDRQDRDRLRGDDPRHQAAVERDDVDDADGDHDAERGAEGEAEQRRGERHPGVVDEAALAPRLDQEGRLEERRRPPDAAREASASAATASCR